MRDLRAFFDDITIWGGRPAPDPGPAPRRHPRQTAPLPRALPPDVDQAFMRAVSCLDDTAARAGITVLRGTGLRIGELLDL